MRTILNLTAFVVAVSFVGQLPADEKEDESPSAALMNYYNALKEGDLEEAKGLTASFAGLPGEYIDGYTEKYSKGVKAGALKIVLVPGLEKQNEDCAVVIFEEGRGGKPDYDPAYLIKQDGDWKVFLKLTSWDLRGAELADEQKARFEELAAWFKEEKARLYAE